MNNTSEVSSIWHFVLVSCNSTALHYRNIRVTRVDEKVLELNMEELPVQ